MPKAIRTDTENNRTTGIALPALRGDSEASVAQQVHDGDTLSVRPAGDIGVRLLGIDTPEVSFAFPGPKLRFVSLGDASWNEFLKTPLDEKWGPYSRPLSEELQSWIAAKTVGSPGAVHNEHADRATAGLRDMITQDMEIMGQDLKSFSYYLQFGFEVMDGYGRFLCMANRNQPERTVPTDRPPTYNMRMLQQGLAFPYFIWPNVNPFDRPDSIADAVIAPGTAKQLAESDTELKMARSAVKEARTSHKGLYDATDPCLIEPFELRFLSRRSLPSRYVIDLTSDSNRLIPPERYFEVPLPEDRMWISNIYVPLFEKAGWVIA